MIFLGLSCAPHGSASCGLPCSVLVTEPSFTVKREQRHFSDGKGFHSHFAVNRTKPLTRRDLRQLASASSGLKYDRGLQFEANTTETHIDLIAVRRSQQRTGLRSPQKPSPHQTSTARAAQHGLVVPPEQAAGLSAAISGTNDLLELRRWDSNVS